MLFFGMTKYHRVIMTANFCVVLLFMW